MSHSPGRLQLRRTHGWRKPADAVVVARPGRFGNPFRIGDTAPDGSTISSREQAVALFRRWLEDDNPDGHRRAHHLIRAQLPELRGCDLACWCPLDGACHADVLIELANR